jgi:hypothetical protein
LHSIAEESGPEQWARGTREYELADRNSPTAQVFAGALGWIDANLDRFDSIAGRVEPDTSKLKPLLELAVLCTSLMQRGDVRGDRRIERFLDLIRATHGNPIFRERVFRTGNDFVPYTLLAIALKRAGMLEQEDWRGLQYQVDHGNVTVSEQVPHRMLDLRHMLDSAGLDHRLPAYARLYRHTTLAKGVSPVSASTFDVYSMTHTLFYLTDWGAQPASAIPASHRKRLSWLIDQLLGMAIRRGNWDLSGELLLAAHCLGSTDSALYALGWEALIGAQWPDGAVPGPTYSGARAATPDQDGAASYVFDTCCHTTLVAAFAGGICAPALTR